MNVYFGKAGRMVVAPQQIFAITSDEQGLKSSLLFVTCMALVSAVLLALVVLFTEGFTFALAGLVKSIVVLPIVSVLSWLGAGTLLHAIWKLFGSSQGYYLSLRLTACLYALQPLWVLAELISPVAQVIVIAWAALLMVLASEQIHQIARWKAVLIFAVIAFLFGQQVVCGCCEEPADIDGSLSNVVSAKLAEGDSSAEANQNLAEAGIAETEPESIGFDESDKSVVEDRSRVEVIAVEGAVEIEAERAADSKEEPATDERFGLTPGEFGYKLGDMVREVRESVADVSEDFKRGLESAEEPTETAQIEQTEVLPSPDDTTSEPQESSLTPAELGSLLGQFIRQMDQAARAAEQGFAEAMADSGASDSEGSSAADQAATNQTAEQAGRSLGEFIKAFNEAIGSLEVSAEEEQ